MNKFTNENLEKSFNDFIEQNQNDNHSLAHTVLKSGDLRKQKIAFVMDTLFNDDVMSNDFDFDNFIFDENESNFDAIYTNFTKDANNIVFLKIIDSKNVDEISSIIFNLYNYVKSYIENQNTTLLSIKEKNMINDLIESLINNDCIEKFTFNNKNVRTCFVISLNEKEKAQLSSKLSTNIQKMWQTVIVVLNEETLLENVMGRKSRKTWITDGELELDKENNFLSFKQPIINDKKSDVAIIDESLIVNVKGESINKLWKNHEQGLLNLNLRYYVKNTKVDTSIKNTINENPGKFWYLNNGLLILCRDYEIKGKSIKLKNFSIVNGGQTTSLLGSFNEINNNLFVVTKIIKLNTDEDHRFYDLASEIAEASNKQKPIKDKDLIANNSSLIELKTKMYEFNNPRSIFINTRRGEFSGQNDFVKNKFKDSYSVVEAEELLQTYAAFIQLIPGTARNSKSKLYKDGNAFNVFSDLKNKLELTYDFSLAFHVFVKNSKSKANIKEINKIYKKKENESGCTFNKELKFQSENCAKFMGLMNISLLKLILIYLKSSSNSPEIWKNLRMSGLNIGKKPDEFIENTNQVFKKINIKRIFKPDIKIEKIIKAYNLMLTSTFVSIFNEAIRNARQINNADEKTLTAANFTKIDNNFYNFVLNAFFNNIQYLVDENPEFIDILDI